MRLQARLQEYIVPIIFVVIGISACILSEATFPSMLDQFVFRITLNGILVLALLPPLQAGMGFNFATGIGIWAAQVGFMVVAAYGLSGASGTGLAIIVGLLLAACLGLGLGWLLSRMPGFEMLMTLILTPLAMFPLMLLTLGIRNVLPPPTLEWASRRYETFVPLGPFQHSLDSLVTVGPLEIPIGPIALLVMAALVVLWFQRRQDSAVVPDSNETGVSARSKVVAFTLSLMLACVSHSIVLQNMPGVYAHSVTPHSGFSHIAALVAGGALLHLARLRHAFLGLVVFNLVYIPLPELTLDMTDVVKRIFVCGLIIYALIHSRKAAPQNSQVYLSTSIS